MIRLNKKQQGIGLLELMLSLAIITAIVLLALRFYNAVNLTSKANTATRMLQAVISASEDWRYTRKTYTGITGIKDLADLGYVPADFVDPSAHPWGGAIIVSSVDADTVILGLDDIPEKGCELVKLRLTTYKVYDGKCAVSGGTKYQYRGKYPIP